mgnify:CR=1 FL=1
MRLLLLLLPLGLFGEAVKFDCVKDDNVTLDMQNDTLYVSNDERKKLWALPILLITPDLERLTFRIINWRMDFSLYADGELYSDMSNKQQKNSCRYLDEADRVIVIEYVLEKLNKVKKIESIIT